MLLPCLIQKFGDRMSAAQSPIKLKTIAIGRNHVPIFSQGINQALTRNIRLDYLHKDNGSKLRLDRTQISTQLNILGLSYIIIDHECAVVGGDDDIILSYYRLPNY